MIKRTQTVLRSILLLILLVLPNIYACYRASDLSSPVKIIAYLLVVCIGLVLPMLFFKRRTYFIVMGVLYLFCAPIEIVCLHLNHNPATTTFVGLLYATNFREVIGILGAVWPIVVGWVAVWALYFIFASRQPDEWIIPRRRGLLITCGLLPVLFVGSIGFFSFYARHIYNIHEPKEVVLFAKELTLMKFYKIFPYNIYLNSFQIAEEQRAIKRDQEKLSAFHFGITSLRDSMPEIYVLIIGEAARSSNFSLNGYMRPTTPRLAQRDNLISFPYTYSQAGITEQSVPHMLSRIPIIRHDKVYTEKTLPEAFQEAGYQTAWLTNKSRAMYLQRVLDCMDQRFETGKDMSTGGNYDHLLLAPLHNILSQEANKQFIVLHTMGSHWRYDTRYTASFERFAPALGEDFRLSMISPNNRDRLVNAYDNTIVYTDYFIDTVLAIIQEKHQPALVIYTSDHGENLYDDERQLILHGNYSASKWLFHVPFLVWYSDEYAALYPEKIANLRAHANSRDNSSVIFPSMADAAGLEYKNDTASNIKLRTRSIFSDDYTSLDTLYVMTAEEECIVLYE